MKYRKKPVVIEAFKYGHDVVPDWAFNAMQAGIIYPDKTQDDVIFRTQYIKTTEGTVFANFGDYILKGVEGEIYPCRASVFEATYEKVDE